MPGSFLKNNLLAEFEPRDIATLENYLLDFQQTPKYKKILASTVKFSGMYRPITSLKKLQTDFTGRVGGHNELCRIKRAQIYLKEKDLIKTYKTGAGRTLVVTSRGRKIFFHDLPLARLREQPWDNLWTVTMYDFPEKKRRNFRDRLRRKLNSFGFGSPQRSVMVSPLPVHEELEKMIHSEEMEKEVWVMRAERVLGMEDKKIASTSWPLKDINSFYKTLIKIYPKAQEENMTKEWTQLFLAVDNQDPYLPKELLPKNWKHEKCKKLFYQTGQAGLLKAFCSKIF